MAGSPASGVQECVEGYIFCGRPPRFLILRRPPARGRIWVPVSGKVEPTDPDFLAALRRELAEETGIVDPQRSWPLDWEVEFDGPDGRRWRLHGFAVELDQEVTPRLSEEHEAFAWWDAAEAKAHLHYPDNREAIDRLLGALENSGANGPPSSL